MSCADCGALLAQDSVDPCACGSTRRDLGITPITAVAHAEAHVRGTTKSDERVLAGGRTRRAVESRFGDDFHRDDATWWGFAYTVDRKNGRYRERLTTPDGEVVLDVDEPLSEHRRHGAASQ